MASAAMATSQAKRCSGDLTVLRKSNTSRRLQLRIQRSKLEKIRGNAEDPAWPPDLVGFGAVPFETEPHRVTEYAKTARPYSISCRADLLVRLPKIPVPSPVNLVSSTKCNLQIYGSARASGQLNNAGRKLCSACILTTLIMTWRSWSAKAELWGAKLSDYVKLSPRKQKPESLCLISRKCTP